MTALPPITTSSSVTSSPSVASPISVAFAAAAASRMPGGVDVVKAYEESLVSDPQLPMPIAAMLAMAAFVADSKASTMQEMLEELRSASQCLKDAIPNPVSLTAGLDLFVRFVITKRWEGDDFPSHKASIVSQARAFALNAAPNCREKIVELTMPFIRDGAVILTHSYSRVVMQVLLRASREQHKRVSVYVTEARPAGLGLKTYEDLTAAGIPCTVVLDSAVAYVMGKVDMVLMGAEGVVESGGVLNAVGSYQMALIAKAASKPCYALAESYKFLRMFPLDQYDLPVGGGVAGGVGRREGAVSAGGRGSGGGYFGGRLWKGRGREGGGGEEVLGFVQPPPRPTTTTTTTSEEVERRDKTPAGSQVVADGAEKRPHGQKPTYGPGRPYGRMSLEMEAANPAVDYTVPGLVTFVFSDVGVLTPSGVGDALLAVYGGE